MHARTMCGAHRGAVPASRQQQFCLKFRMYLFLLSLQFQHQPACRYYARPEAWRLPPLLRESVRRVRAAGVPVAVISNFDDRLRPIMEAMAIDDLFDAVLVSSEVGAEKPSPRIFDAACEAVGVDPSEQFVVHVGDDRRNDVWGARQRGIQGWLWGEDVASFEEIADRVVTGHTTV